MKTADKVDFIRLRRCAPGRFTEQMLNVLSGDLSYGGYDVAVQAVELGDDPVCEKLNVTFLVSGAPLRTRRFSGEAAGPKLFFTFSSETSVDDNLDEFRQFVLDHAHTAERVPALQSNIASHHGD